MPRSREDVYWNFSFYPQIIEAALQYGGVGLVVMKFKFPDIHPLQIHVLYNKFGGDSPIRF